MSIANPKISNIFCSLQATYYSHIHVTHMRMVYCYYMCNMQAALTEGPVCSSISIRFWPSAISGTRGLAAALLGMGYGLPCAG